MGNMETEEVLEDLNKRVSGIFSDFMSKIAKFDELVSVASNLLVGFQQHLELLRRPSLSKTSEVVANILKANQTERLKAYVESGCRNVHDGVQSLTKLNACQEALQDHVCKAKKLLKEVKTLMDDVIREVQTLPRQYAHISGDFLHQKEESEAVPLRKHQVADYTGMMAIIYSMLSQDCLMQEKIVSSLNLNISSEELESYCLMWSLRPYIDDDVMNHAWKYIR
ncbi:hypothetical protein ACHQM5_000175 [Ranunculus cassubicifolius]